MLMNQIDDFEDIFVVQLTMTLQAYYAARPRRYREFQRSVTFAPRMNSV